jgi:hypothetical protein
VLSLKNDERLKWRREMKQKVVDVGMPRSARIGMIPYLKV